MSAFNPHGATAGKLITVRDHLVTALRIEDLRLRSNGCNVIAFIVESFT